MKTDTPSPRLRQARDWLKAMRTKIEAEPVTDADLDALAAALGGDAGAARIRRQRLLYLHAASPSVRSPVVGSAMHEPEPDSVTQIDPLQTDMPYASVFDAILDGWRVIHFPQQRAPYDDREIDVIGYEFILEKIEAYDV